MALTAKQGGRSVAIDSGCRGNQHMSKLKVMFQWFLGPLWSVGNEQNIALGQSELSQCCTLSIIYHSSLSLTFTPSCLTSFTQSIYVCVPLPASTSQFLFSTPCSINLGQALFSGLMFLLVDVHSLFHCKHNLLQQWDHVNTGIRFHQYAAFLAYVILGLLCTFAQQELQLHQEFRETLAVSL